MTDSLNIENLNVEVNSKTVLRDISFDIKPNEIVVLMGPNGAGKSTISNSIMGNPKYEIKKGSIKLGKKNMTELDSTERSKEGIYMSFQHPIEIDGVTMLNFLRTSYNKIKEKNLNVGDFIKLLEGKMKELKMDKKFRSRFVNHGFSGGEKKRSELLQMLLLEPKFAILDEIDSGLDVDSIKLVTDSIKKLQKENNTGFLLITHSSKILEYLKADKVIVLKDGKIEKTGDHSLIKKIEKEGFNND